MMKLPPAVASSIQKRSRLGSDVWVSHNTAVIFGAVPYDDLAFLSPVKGRLASSHYQSDHPHHWQRQSETASECDNLIQRVQNLRRSTALVSFIMDQHDLRVLIDAGRHQTATHLRFYNSGAALRINVIDARKFDNESQLRRKNTLTIRYLELFPDIDRDFSWTTKFDSFAQLPVEDYDVYIRENGIGEFVSLKTEEAYLIRDQHFIEPVVVFHSPHLMRDISFVFHPMKDLPNLDTTQSG